jgi:hypothetical protein
MLSAARAELREARQVEASRECQSPQVQHQGIPLTNLSFDISLCVPLRPLWLKPFAPFPYFAVKRSSLPYIKANRRSRRNALACGRRLPQDNA